MQDATSADQRIPMVFNVGRKVLFAAGITLMAAGFAIAVTGCTWSIIRTELFGSIDMDELPGLDVTGWGCVVAAAAAAVLLLSAVLLPKYADRTPDRDRIRWHSAGVLLNVVYWCAWPAIHVIRERYFEGPLNPAVNAFLARFFVPAKPMLFLVKILVPARFGLHVYLYVAYVVVATWLGSACWSACVTAAHVFVERHQQTEARPNSP
jgi:hypothetical protein